MNPRPSTARPKGRTVLLVAALLVGPGRFADAQKVPAVGGAGGLPRPAPGALTIRPARAFVGDEVVIGFDALVCGTFVRPAECTVRVSFGEGSQRPDLHTSTPIPATGEKRAVTFATRYHSPGDKSIRVDVEELNVYFVGVLHVSPSPGGFNVGPVIIPHTTGGGSVAPGPPPSGGKGGLVGVAGGLPRLDPAPITFKPAKPFVGDEVEISFEPPVCGALLRETSCGLHVALGEGSSRGDFSDSPPLKAPGEKRVVTYRTHYRSAGDKAIRIDVDDPNVYLSGKVHVSPAAGVFNVGPPTPLPAGGGVAVGPPPTAVPGNVGLAGGVPRPSKSPLTIHPSVVAVGVEVDVSFPTPNCGSVLRPGPCIVHVAFGDGSNVADFQAIPTDPDRQKTMSFRTRYLTIGRKTVRIDIEETNEFLTGFVTVSAAAGPAVSPQPKAANLPR